VPTEEARRSAITHVAHACFQRQASGIQGQADGEIDGKRIAGAGTDRVGGERCGGRRVAGCQIGDREIRVAHETVAELARGAGDAGLEIEGLAVEAVARIGNASAEWGEDGEVRT